MAVVDISNTFQMSKSGEHIDNTDVYNSNRNLLDNPWWGSGEVVNQRSVSSGTAPSFQYTIDRWKMNPSSNVTYSLGTEGITFTVPSAGYIQMIQYFLNPAMLNGKTLTASVLLSNGTVHSGTISRTNGTAQIFFNTGSLAALLQTDNTFRVTAYATQTIRAVKLELGSYSTLANDVPPDYGEELLKCQRYFYRMNGAGNYSAYGLAIAATTEHASMFVTLPTVMRTTPTISRGGTFQLRVFSTGDTRGITNLIVDTIAGNTAKLSIYATLTVGWIMQLRNAGGAGYIDFSADL